MRSCGPHGRRSVQLRKQIGDGGKATGKWLIGLLQALPQANKFAQRLKVRHSKVEAAWHVVICLVLPSPFGVTILNGKVFICGKVCIQLRHELKAIYLAKRLKKICNCTRNFEDLITRSELAPWDLRVIQWDRRA